MGIALLTVAGTLGGIVVGALITRRSADTAWVREQRLHAFAATASGVATITLAAWLVAQSPSDEHFEAWDASVPPASDAATRLRLVGSPATKHILEELWSTINELEERVAGFRIWLQGRPADSPPLDATEDVLRCREKVVTVRKALLRQGESEFP
jgi:hypothetical protein